MRRGETERRGRSEVETCGNVYHKWGSDEEPVINSTTIARQNDVMQLTFKWAYNAVE